MERNWELSDAVRRNPFHGYSQHFNIAPTTQIPIIYPGDEGIEMRMARWGLVPLSDTRSQPSQLGGNDNLPLLEGREGWLGRIQSKIWSTVVVPSNIQGNPEVRFEIVLLPGGEVSTATLKKSSGNPVFDAAIERGIMAAQPLPVPSETEMFQAHFRELVLIFRPKL
jgi:TonB family protein